jgi:ketosteroid isomerase-like protein
MLRVGFMLSCLVSTPTIAQVPADLREAMRARDEAVAKADAATWDRLTADDFTVVQADGILMTKAERLAQFKTQQAMTPQPARQEQIKHYGDIFVRRALVHVRSGDAWVLDIWVKYATGWRVTAVQVTSAKK